MPRPTDGSAACGAAISAPSSRDSIFALSTAPGPGAIAVVRLSGPRSGPALAALLAGRLPPPRRFAPRLLRDAAGEALDRAVVAWLPATHGSYSGEDMAELQVHGGVAVVRRLLATLAAMPGLRPAEPGEFTRRAFENGRLDLLEAEAVSDLVAAETEAQRRLALAGSHGRLSARLDEWHERLVLLSARAEATIDFGEEELPSDLLAACRSECALLAAALGEAVGEVGRGERLRRGFEVALLGAPNAGKSSLLNALARREAAIVHERAGTTRDVVEVRLDLAGLPVTLLDTAGLRSDADDPVEREGMRRARARAAAADLVILLFDADILPTIDRHTLDLVDERSFLLWSKADLLHGDGPPPSLGGQAALPVSARSGAGLASLEAALAARLEGALPGQGDVLFNRERHRVALRDCAEALDRAAQATEAGLMAEDLRLARVCLGRLSGRIDVEDVLDRIFSEFCIGK